MESKIVIFDLECTNLQGNLGRVLCGSFLPLDNDEVTTISRLDRKYKGKATDDSKVTYAIKEMLESYWMWIGWNSKLFDIPFLNARLVKHGFEPVNRRLQADIMYYARGQSMKLNNSKLRTVINTFGLTTQKTDLDFDTWADAAMGDNEALKYVIEHCEADVKATREAFDILRPFIRNLHY